MLDTLGLEYRPGKWRYSIAEVMRKADVFDRQVQLARETPEVVECYRITGEDCFFIKLHLRSMDDLEAILDRFVLYGQTTTSIIHSAPITSRQLPTGTASG